MNNKRYLIIGIIVVLVAAIAVVCALVLGDKKETSNKGDLGKEESVRTPAEYDEILDKQIAAINEEKANYWDYSDNGSIKQDIDFQKYYLEIAGHNEVYEDFFQEYFDEVKESMGADYEVSYTINEEKKFTEEEVEGVREYFAAEVEAMYEAMEENKSSIREELEGTAVAEEDIATCISMYEEAILGYKEMVISDVYRLNIKVNVVADDNKDGFEMEILIVKIDGSWVFMQENEYLDKKYYSFSSGITPYTLCANICEQE